MTLAEVMRLRREMQEAQAQADAHLDHGRTPEAMAKLEEARTIRLKLMRLNRWQYGRVGR